MKLKFINNDFINMTKGKYYDIIGILQDTYHKGKFIKIYTVIDNNNCIARFSKDNFEIEKINDKWNELKEFIKTEMNKDKVLLADSCYFQLILNKMYELEENKSEDKI